MNQIEEILNELEFEYEKEFDKEDNISIYYTGIVTNSEENLDIMIILNNNYNTLTIYVPEMVPIPKKVKFERLAIALNEINMQQLYGTLFIREGKEFISYRNSHSTEGDSGIINKEQFQDYIGSIYYSYDEIIEYAGKLVNDYN